MNSFWVSYSRIIMIWCSLERILVLLVLSKRKAFVLEYLTHEMLIYYRLQGLGYCWVRWSVWFAKECVI